MSVKYSKWPYLKYINISQCKANKVYQNWNFRFENKPSGNPDSEGAKNLCCILMLTPRMLTAKMSNSSQAPFPKPGNFTRPN
jgi:hypothetical protein